MRPLVQWAVKNSPALNTLLLGVMVLGALSISKMRRETFPEFDLDMVLVTVPYPGASPAEVEDGICQKIEEAVRSVAGIKKQTAVAQEGSGFLVLELETDADAQKILNEIRSEVDRIPSFPELAEDPEVKLITLRQAAINVGVIGPDDASVATELKLRELAERIRYEILRLPSVSQATLQGTRDYQIDIEISEDNLRKHGLSLQKVAEIVRRENVELPGGSMKSSSQEILLRGKNERKVGTEIAHIPIVTQANGVVLTVSDLGRVSDAFTDDTAITEINGKPGISISVDRTSSEDLLRIVDEVKAYVASVEMPPGYSLVTWFDRSEDVRDRLDMLVRNGFQGLALVFIVLAIFLELKLAFWVALGIPVSILGAGIVLLYNGQTLNMLSMFSFLMALGIVVDDAIVIGENIFEHRQRGKRYMRAAVDGTLEVLPSVTASVCTTIIAFVPLMFVAGIMGKFIAVMPLAVIAMLVISLVESTFILPCHLSHDRNLFLAAIGHVLYPMKPIAWLFSWLNQRTSRLLSFLISRTYLPSLEWSIRRPVLVVSLAASLLLATAGAYMGGITPWKLMPNIDVKWVNARITFPDGTPGHVTEKATRQLLAAIERVSERYAETGHPLIKSTRLSVGSVSSPGLLGPETRSSGSHVGSVEIEMVDNSKRSVHSDVVLDEWREEAGDFPGAENLVYGTPQMGPGGAAIEFKLLAEPELFSLLEDAVEQCKQKLSEYPGVVDVRDDSRPGKWEYQIRIKPQAESMGVSLADVAESVRSAYYGAEAMRLQRGRHEVKLMVRYPPEERRSYLDLDEMRIQTADGTPRPLAELADIRVDRGYSEVNRVDQVRSITITADVVEGVANASEVSRSFQASFLDDLVKQHPEISVRWEGEREQNQESVASLVIGFLGAMIAMFVLLTVEFRSYVQPLIILLIIPFGAVGTIWGHALLGMPVSMFTLFGFMALTGVVVNDSIVLIDFINHRLQEGLPLREALVQAGQRRFRPVVLTSLTTVAGVSPILFETSFQAQILIPMAAALVFGLAVATGLILILVPTFYALYYQMLVRFGLNGEETPDSASDHVLPTEKKVGEELVLN